MLFSRHKNVFTFLEKNSQAFRQVVVQIHNFCIKMAEWKPSCLTYGLVPSLGESVCVGAEWNKELAAERENPKDHHLHKTQPNSHE